MIIGISVICCSLLYTIMVSIVYFSKKKVNTIENKIYSILISISIIGLLLELGCCYFLYNKDISPMYGFLNIFINKIFVTYLLIWELLFTIYIFVISFFNKNVYVEKITKNKGKIISFISVICIVMIMLVILLPLYYYNDGTYLYSYGPATSLLYIMGGIFIIFDNFCLFKNFKEIKNKKYLPLFVLIVLMIFVLILRQINPGLIIINSVFSFVTVLIFFTIENPDVKLIQELNENRILVEKTNEEKSNFLFKMSQELKSPVLYMEELSNSLINEKDSKKVKDGINSINMSSRKLSYIINNVLDVSSIDSKKIKTVNSKYNIYAILDEIKTRLSKNVKSGVDFRFYISDNIPTSLYGDVIKLKQVITTILNNSIKHTNSGFIEVSVESLIKYDVCRLIISIEDSGNGMNISKVNELLRLDDELSDDDIKKLDKLDSDLKIAKKIIKVLGGNLMIKSEEDKGSEFIIVLDQKIVNTNDKSISDKYKNILTNQKKVLIVDDDVEEIEAISNILKEKNIDVTISLYGKDAVDKINSGSKYDLILIDDEMSSLSGLGTLQELQKIKNFKIKTIVMLNKDKLKIKNSYLEDGFSDYLNKDTLNSSLNDIIEKFI